MPKRKASFTEFATGKYRRKDSTSSTFGDTIGRFSSSASGAALGFIGGDVPGAVAGAVMGARAYDYARANDQFEAIGPDAELPQRKNMGKATYSGFIKKPKYQKPTYMDNASKKGSIVTFETYGSVSDPHAVYVNHSTYQFESISFALRFAMIRKLLVIAGVPILNRYDELPLNRIDNSTGFRVVYVHYNPLNGIKTEVGYNILDNETLTDVTNAFVAFENLIEAYMNGAAGNQEPYKLLLYTFATGADITTYRLAGQFNISDELFTMFMFSNLKVQNRTAGDLAPAGDLNIDRSDTQPLVVTCYEFRNADARMRSATAYGISDHSLNGCSKDSVRLLRAGSTLAPTDFGPTNDFQNAPSKVFFQNCNGVSKTVLQPGQMKEAIISYKMVGKGISFFTKLKYENLIPGSGQISNVLGRGQILCFEEKMRTVSTNPVKIHYERKFSVCCFSVTKKSGYIQPNSASAEYNV